MVITYTYAPPRLGLIHRNGIGWLILYVILLPAQHFPPPPLFFLKPAEFNSIPSIKKLVPGGYDGMKLRVQLAVPDKYSKELDLEAVRKVFPYGKMAPIEVGGCRRLSLMFGFCSVIW